MIGRHSARRLLALAALACAFALPLRGNAALFVDAPASGPPGGTFVLEIGLNAAFVAGIDELALVVAFDPGVLTGQAAMPGPLLANGLFGTNPPAGTAIHSFLTPLAGLGPGTVASWTFGIAPAAVPGTATAVSATLRTFVSDSELTAELASAPLTISVVPEPSIAWLLAAGLAGMGALRALGRRRSPQRAKSTAVVLPPHTSTPTLSPARG